MRKVYCSECGHPFEGNFCPQCGHPADPSGNLEQIAVSPTNPEGNPMIGQNYESTLRAFIGPNADYYLEEFRKIENGEKTSITWRGLLGGIPLLYRKMVKDYFFIFLIGLIPIAGIFLLIPRIFRMNKLYYAYVNRKLAENGLTGVEIGQAGVSATSKARALGGTSVGLMVSVILGMMTLLMIIQLLISTISIGLLTFMAESSQHEGRPMSQEEQKAPASSSVSESTGGSGFLGEYHLSIDGLDLTQGDDQVYGIVTFTFTNQSSENCSFSNAFHVQAFQNGVEVPEDLFHFLLNETGDNSIKDIRPGSSLQVQTAYRLSDLAAPVVVEASLVYSFSDEKIEREFSLKELSAQAFPQADKTVCAMDFMGSPMSSVVSAFGEGYTINNFLLSYQNTEIPYGFSGTLDTGKYVPDETIDYIALGPGAYIDEHVYIGMYHDEIAKYHPMQSPSPQKSDTGEYNLFQSMVDGIPCTVCIDFDESGRSTHAFMKLGEETLSDSAPESSTLSAFSDFYGTWKLEEGSAILVVTQDAFGERPYTVTDVQETYDSVEITVTVFEETFSYNQRAIIYNGDSPLRMMLYTENASGLFSGGTGFYKIN